MGPRTSRSYRASEVEMDKIERAAAAVGLPPSTLVRNVALAAAQRILQAAGHADGAVPIGKEVARNSRAPDRKEAEPSQGARREKNRRE